MKKCCFVIPYFGNFPDYFPLFLQSCAENPSFDWMIFTDNQRKFNYPKNVHVSYCTFESIKNRIRELFPFHITLDEPYKLCDYRIAYGEIFAKELASYDFWGFCDTDVIFGNLAAFITDDVLTDYDRILARGHLTLLRNIEGLRTIYRSKSQSLFIDYRYAFTTSYSCHFDEFEPWHEVFREQGYKQWVAPIMADIDCDCYDFHLVGDNRDSSAQIFQWKNGKLLRLFLDDESNIENDEWAYVHFQKRKMKVDSSVLQGDDGYFIIPNFFLPSSCVAKDLLKRVSSKSLVHNLYFQRRKKRCKEIIHNVLHGALRFRMKKYMHD